LTPLLSAGDPAVLSVLLAAETPGFEPDHPVVVDSDNADFQAPTLIDVDGDGNLDIALTRSVFFGRGDGTFIDRTRVLLDKPPINIEAADLDGDGHLDLLGTSNNQHVTIDLAFGDGAGSFPTVTTLDLGGAAQGVAVSDVNGDGHPDLALASGAAGAATGPLSVRLNSGSGLAWGDAIPLDAMDIGPPLLADLNGDGNLDVVDAKPQAKTLSVHAGDGQGAFFAPVTSPAGVSASVFVLADLDSDGALDAILADSANETVLTMHGSGAGSFDAAVTIPVGMLASDIDIGDIDADGLLDCAVASMDTDTLLILAGQATGTFGTLSSIPISGPSSAVKLHDLDRDGRIDVILAQQQLDAVGVLRGLGSGALGPEQIHGVGNKPVDLLLADFDEDGFQDVGVPVKSPGAFNVLWNTTTFFPSLGFQLGSGALMPHLKGSGLPAPDDVVSFEVSGIPGPTPGFLILGLSFSPFAFKGGTLVPSPDVAVPMRAGTPLAGRWPKLPPGTAVYAQAWFAASSDVTASNAVVGVTQ